MPKDLVPQIQKALSKQRDTPEIAVVGDLNFDIIKLLVGPPELEKEAFILSETRVPAGSSGIYAATAGLLDSNVDFASMVGEDPDGNELIEFMQGRGVNTQHIQQIPDGRTAYTDIYYILNLQKRQILTLPGVFDQFTSVNPSVLDDKSLLHSSSYFVLDKLQPAIPRLFRTASRRGLTVSFDPNGMAASGIDTLVSKVFPNVDRLYLNQDEAAAATGTQDAYTSLDTLTTQIRPNGLVVVKQGEQGATARYNGQTVHVGAFYCSNVKDQVGAGDTFDATCNHYLEQGLSLDHSLILASANARASLNEQGGPPGQQPEGGLLRMLNDYCIYKRTRQGIPHYDIIPRYKAFLFDLDGLFADSEKLHLAGQNRMLTELLGKPTEMTPEDLQEVVGQDEIETCRYLKQKYELDPPVDEISDLRIQKVAEVAREQGVERMSGVYSALQYAKKHGLKTGIASSSCDELVDVFLDELGYSRSDFDVVVTGTNIRRKPEPDIYVEAAKQLDLDPMNCLAFEDSRSGMLAAQAAGMRCIVVPNKHSRDQNFKEAFMVADKLTTTIQHDFYQAKQFYPIAA